MRASVVNVIAVSIQMNWSILAPCLTTGKGSNDPKKHVASLHSVSRWPVWRYHSHSSQCLRTLRDQAMSAGTTIQRTRRPPPATERHERANARRHERHERRTRRTRRTYLLLPTDHERGGNAPRPSAAGRQRTNTAAATTHQGSGATNAPTQRRDQTRQRSGRRPTRQRSGGDHATNRGGDQRNNATTQQTRPTKGQPRHIIVSVRRESFPRGFRAREKAELSDYRFSWVLPECGNFRQR